jgi:glyoxylase-like metal-dependent hydrolase (beta-lactamase superfamily II)
LQLAQGIHLIKCPYRSKFFTNFYTTVCAILGAKEIALIDSGVTTSPEEAILPYLHNMGRKPEEITHLILTHGHFDHAGGAALLKKRYSAKVAVHKLDRPFLEDALLEGRQSSSRFGTPIPKEAAFASVEADITLEDGDTLTVAGRELSFLHLPGHSRGSIAVVDRELGLYLTGDTPQGRGPAGPLIFHDSVQYGISVQRLCSEPVERLVLGHPFQPFQKAVLNGDEAKLFAKESLAAVEELRTKVYGKLKEAKKPSTLEEIHNKLPGTPLISVGCILESLANDGKARILRTDACPMWTMP